MMDSILNVLIVEDEKPIREDLALFPWDDYAALLIGEAANGAEALEICREVTPDVIVTDITMPRMDGLTLMEKAGKLYPGTAFIILSCHEDFEYAQKALQLGAVDYVTKVGMRDEHLKQALGKARKQVHMRRHFRQSRWSEDYWGRTSRFYDFRNAGGSLPVEIRFPCRLAAIHTAAQRSDLIFVHRRVMKYLENSDAEGWMSGGANEHLCVYEDSDTVAGQLKTLLINLRETGIDQLNLYIGDNRIYGSLSQPLNSPEEFMHERNTLVRYRDNAFYDEQKFFFTGCISELPEIDAGFKTAAEEEFRKREHIPENLTAYLCNDFLVRCREERFRSDQLTRMLLDLRAGWKRIFLRSTDEARFQARLSGVSRLSDLLRLLVTEIEENCSDNTNARRPEIRKAVEIIKTNFAENPSLTSVAEQVGLSSAYLSRIFAQETGYSFKDYLTGIRIEAAAALLRTPGSKVYEVAEAVGFPSYRYFSSVFKAMTGQRPKQYQQGGAPRNSG